METDDAGSGADAVPPFKMPNMIKTQKNPNFCRDGSKSKFFF